MTSNNNSARNFIPISNKFDRVILLVDMDCFYCQVEEKLNPELKNQPIAVVQYNAWRGGGIIAVNYAARAKGVTRHMRGDEAKEQCPEIQLVKVPNVREKADLTKYREAGKDVANVLQRFTPLLERASVDEAYLDITEAVNKRLQEMNDGTFILQPQELINTYVVGFQTIGEFVTAITTSFITNTLSNEDNFNPIFNEYDASTVRQSNIRLLIGASIASEIRSAVKAETSFECSAGIAHNKILAKLACGINKPNKQTILPLAEIPGLFETLPVGKIKGLGAKFGEEICERLNIRYLGQMLKFTEAELQKKFDEKNGTWLYNICRGIDLEAVTPRFYSKSIGCCKKFPGRNNITGIRTLQHWLNELANEISERLEKDIYENNRRAKQIVVNFIQEIEGEEVSSSRSAPLQCYDSEMLAKTSLEIIKTNTKQFFRSGSESVLNNPIKFLGISAGKFETISNSKNNIQEMFALQAAKKEKLKTVNKDETKATSPNTNSESVADILETNTENGNQYSHGHEPNEKDLKNANSCSLDAADFINVQTNSCFNSNNEANSNTLKEVPKEKKTSNLKSFFLNALRKEKSTERDKGATESFTKPESNLSSATSVKTISPAQLEVLSDNKSKGNVKQIPQKNVFQMSYTIENQNTKICESSATALNSGLNTIPNEIENISGSNAVIEENVGTVLEPNLQTTNNVLNDVTISLKRKYDTISDNQQQEQELNQTDYRSEYVEFALPELTPNLLQFTTCSKCGVKILNDAIAVQTHEDHHYAQELNRQQRHEFRDEIRTKIISSKSPPNKGSKKTSKKIKLPNSSIKKISGADITKFLQPSLSNTLPSNMTCDQNQDLQSSTSDVEICDICKLPIKTEVIMEHKDFHIAKDLQKKLNQLEVHTVEIAKKPASASVRKSHNSSMLMSPRHNKTTAKPITHFFNPANT